jgi:hypothetical protein
MPLQHETRHPYSPIRRQHSTRETLILAPMDNEFPHPLPRCSILQLLYQQFGTKRFSQFCPFIYPYWTTKRESYAKKSKDEGKNPHPLSLFARRLTCRTLISPRRSAKPAADGRHKK